MSESAATARSLQPSTLTSLESQIHKKLSFLWSHRMEGCGGEDVNPDPDLDPGDLDVLIKRFLNLKGPKSPTIGPDLDGSFQDDDLFKENHQNTSACDYQWFNDELGFGTYGENETGAPLCIGINTDYDVANIDMEHYASSAVGIFKLSGSNPEDPEQNPIQGEGIASITGSILQQFAAYEDSASGQESADLNNSMEMSICKSENLFSPLADNQPDIPALSTFSTDSLDVRSEILANCAAPNYNNYTIAFNGNNILEESSNTTSSTYRTATTTTPSTEKLNENVNNQRMTDWKEVKTSNNQQRISNNNGSSNDSSSQWTVDNTSHLFTQSCPNSKILMSNRRRIFDLGTRRRTYFEQQIEQETNNSMTESTSNMIIGSPGSHDTSSGGSIPMSSDESMNMIPKSVKSRMDKVKPTSTAQVAEIIKKSIQIQTSYSKGHAKVECSKSVPVYICYPNYTLPDLKFLNENSLRNSNNTTVEQPKNDVYLIPQHYKVPLREKRVTSAGYSRTRRPMSCNDIEELRSRDLSHIRDWPSLHFLLPTEYRTILKDMNMKYEENNEDEKSSEAGLGLDENSSPVVMRKKLSHGTNPTKRYSLNNIGSTPQCKSSRRWSKRFSLQEPIIPEINEITNEINKNLRVLNEMESDMFDLPSGTDSCSGESDVPVPQNTPKISFIENNNEITAAATVRTIQNSMTRISRLHVPNLAEKQSLTEAIAQGVLQIQSVCKPPHGRLASAMTLTTPNIIIFSQTPAGKCVLETLCPTLYSLLSDGLCPFLDTIFGKIPNTVWRVIEASIQYGPTAQTLNELVMKINSEESLAEGPMKFNAFICGLLNLGNLSSWLLFLRTKERLLRTHYDTDGLMFLCNTSTRSLYDQMVENVNYLTKLPFQLDIFHEVKVMHQSIISNKSKKISHGGQSHGGLRSSSASTSRKHSQGIDSNKLCQELGSGMKGYTSSKNSKYYVNQLKKTQMKRSFSDERPNSSKVNIGSSIPKSKTSQNIHCERHYHSNPKISKHSKSGKIGGEYEGQQHRVLRVKDQEKGIEPTKAQQRPKSLGNPTQLLMDEFPKEQRSSGKDSEKFRNLRMQWELLTSDEVRSNKPINLVSPVSGGNNTIIGSKIPRPITSPVKTNNNNFQSPNFKLGKR